ncbi:hypothetical protein [Haloactinomyces albus]|uniref:Uncharacterized protein n=1 Tax=Haloactinomyces albus TaxID=1352928 RepID=A0AAE3ZG07_9ACTN|nr:hypothetical protein [Haloactinomyces albus]MDR7303211.1 hypothetical protein [Haloactinomyces albus]
MSAPEPAPPEAHVWMSGVREAGWHAVAVSASGGAPMAACGHRLSVPVHHRLGDTPPQDGIRVVCPPCTHALEREEHRVPRVSARIDWPTVDPDIRWPETDPDEPETPTRRRPSLDTALALLLTPDTPAPDRTPLPKAGESASTPDVLRPAA